MIGVLVDSNVILDLYEEDSDWIEWPEEMLHQYTHTMYISPIIYFEVSIGFKRIGECFIRVWL